MPPVTLDQLKCLYDSTDDPWCFRSSAYEKTRFRMTMASLEGKNYTQLLEIGCGNGELARHLFSSTQRYVGVDASSVALEAARCAVPNAEFEERFLPCDLPDGQYELIVLSEVLYFLDRAGIESLAGQLRHRWPAAQLLCVNYLGPSGNELQGEESFDYVVQALGSHYRHELVLMDESFRIDRLVPIRSELTHG